MSSDPLASRPKNVLAAFAWANLVLYWAHRQAPTGGPANDYHIRRFDLFATDIGGLLVAVLLLALTGVLLLELARRQGSRVRRAIVGLLGASLVLPLAGIAKDATRAAGLDASTMRVGIALAGGAIAVLVVAALLGRELIHRPRRATAIVLTGLVVTSPFAALVSGQAASSLHRYASLAAEQPASGTTQPGPTAAEGAPSQRILVVVFDGLDRRMAFDHRPEGLELEAFDALAADSVVAEKAVSPSEETLVSMPAMWTGLAVVDVEREAHDALRLRLADGSQRSLEGTDTVFDRARAHGLGTAAVGYHHPYCRILTVDACEWVAHGAHSRTELPFAHHVLRSGARALEAVPDTLMPGQLTDEIADPARAHAEARDRQLETAKGYAAEEAHGLVFAHLNVPHLVGDQGIYDRQAGEVTTDPSSSFMDNLVLADRTLAELRQHLEDRGLWEEMAVVVTSDHGHRGPGGAAEVQDWYERTPDPDVGPADRQVPLLVKPPAGPTDATVTEPVTPRVLPALAEVLWAGEVETGAEIAAFLAAESPQPRLADP